MYTLLTVSNKAASEISYQRNGAQTRLEVARLVRLARLAKLARLAN